MVDVGEEGEEGGGEEVAGVAEDVDVPEAGEDAGDDEAAYEVVDAAHGCFVYVWLGYLLLLANPNRLRLMSRVRMAIPPMKRKELLPSSWDMKRRVPRRAILRRMNLLKSTSWRWSMCWMSRMVASVRRGSLW